MWRFFLDVMTHRPDLYRFDAAEGFEGDEGLTVVFKLPVTRYITAPANVDEEQFMSPSDPAFMAAKKKTDQRLRVLIRFGGDIAVARGDGWFHSLGECLGWGTRQAGRE